jgi:hypothetical protein
MIHFPLLRTARLDVAMRELTLKEGIALAAIPPHQHEAGVTALLAQVVKASGANADPELWTVQERYFAVAHYIACTSEEGGNFEVANGRFLDYLCADIDSAPVVVDAGQACGDTWTAKQLLGCEAGAMEGFCRSRLDWLTADIAARMSVVGQDEGRPDPRARPGDYATWLQDRSAVIQQMAESEFEALFMAYRRGLDGLHHLFALEQDDAGFVVMPTKEGGAALAPARFPVDACLGVFSRLLGSGGDGAGVLPGPALQHPAAGGA